MDPFVELVRVGRDLRGPEVTARWSPTALTARVCADGVIEGWRRHGARGPRLWRTAFSDRDSAVLLVLCALRDDVECARSVVARVALRGEPRANDLACEIAAWTDDADGAAARTMAGLERLAELPMHPGARRLQQRVWAWIAPRDNPWWLAIWVPALIADWQGRFAEES